MQKVLVQYKSIRSKGVRILNHELTKKGTLNVESDPEMYLNHVELAYKKLKFFLQVKLYSILLLCFNHLQEGDNSRNVAYNRLMH